MPRVDEETKAQPIQVEYMATVLGRYVIEVTHPEYSAARIVNELNSNRLIVHEDLVSTPDARQVVGRITKRELRSEPMAPYSFAVVARRSET